MPRKGHIAKRKTESDPIYGSDLVTKFINSMMWQGKKSTAEGIFYKSLQKLQEKGGDEPLKLFTKAVENAKLSSLRVLPVRRKIKPDLADVLGIRQLSNELALL